MNKSILFGRLVKDPDIRYTQTQSGELAIANFRIAVNRKYAKENGPNADFFTCTAFRKRQSLFPIILPKVPRLR